MKHTLVPLRGPVRYVSAVVVVVVALLINESTGRTAPSMLALGGVVVAGWIGRLGPALVATLLSAAGLEVLTLGPTRAASGLGASDATRVVLLLAGGGIVALVMESVQSARQQAEARASEHLRRLEDSEGRLRDFLDHAPASVFAKEREGRYLFVNRRFAELAGLPAEAVLGRTDRELWPESAEKLVEADRRILQADSTIEREEVVAIEGAIQTYLIQKFPLRDGAGRPVGVGGFALDITERKALENALRVSESRFRCLADANILGIVTGGPDGRIREANDAFLRLIGYDRDEVDSGRLAWADLTGREGRARDVRALAELRRGGSCVPFETQLLRRDGGRVPVLVGGAWASDRRECVGFVLDLSERQRAEDELRQAKEAAEAASLAKDRFLAVLSHELRTPLTPVLVAVSAMIEGTLTPGSRPTLEMIRRNIELEARLIDDLIDVSRAAHGQIRLSPRRINVHEEFGRIAESFRAEIEAAGLELRLDLRASAHHVVADPDRLHQLVRHLVHNAGQFTPSGGSITIRTRDEPQPEGGRRRLIVEVADTGVGLAPGARERIFEPFEQVGAPARSRRGGLGLGLPIARALAEAHGGGLSASSPGPGLGSTFRLELLAVEPAAEPTRAQAPSASPSPPAILRLRILLVEDNADTLRFLTLILRRLGHEATPAADLAQAREAAANRTFDLVLSDIELPDGTGLDLMRGLAGRVRGIAMSGFGSEEDVRLSLQAGFATHLTKPIDLKRLEQAIGEVMAGSARRSGLAAC